MLIKVVLTLFATIVQACTDSDCDKSFSEICAENGFKFESHTVTTEDGYILTMMRIPGMLGEQVTSVKPPVFFQHGLFDSSDAFISNWADKAPAFVAVRAGYDVWLGNTRGNKYSRKHVKLNPDINRQQFWDFDLEQMGQYDLPAELDFVATYTGIEKIAYIGHS